ncbi:MAG: glycosyltransferase involved in cell wall biosynthesis, partial [Rhodothermales bacterium]
MRILMILDHAFPPDIRVENEARTLVEAGFEVAILAIGPDDRPDTAQFHGVTILRDNLPGKARDWLRGLSGTFGFSSKWYARRIRAAFRRWPFDALHVHDLYLFGGGIQAGKALGVPVVGDLHENWVEALKHYAWSTKAPAKWVVSVPRWERLERHWVNAVDRLVVVVREASGRNQALGVRPDHIIEVPNTVRIEDFDAHAIDESLVARVNDGAEFTVVYTGGMDIHRGLDNTLRAFAQVAAVRPKARMVFVGDGRIRPALEAQARELGLGEQVWFEGWKEQSLIPSYIRAADVCLVPHRRTVHTDATLPHKLFHYMYAERPVVVTDCLPLDRIVTAEQCGLVVEDRNPAAMAAAILDLVDNPDSAKAMGRRGRDAVLETWNWKATSQDLVAMYQEMGGLTKRRQATPEHLIADQENKGMLGRLIRQGGSYALAGALLKGAGLVLAPLLLNAEYLPVSDYGSLALLMVTAQLVIFMAGLGQPTALLRFMTRADGEISRAGLPATALLISILSAGAAATLLWLFAAPLAGLLTGDPANASILTPLAAYVAIKCVAAVPLALLRVQERAGRYTIAVVLEMAVLIVLAYVELALNGTGLPGLIRAYAWSAGAALLALLLLTGRTYSLRLDPAAVRPLLKFGVPLVLAALAGWFLNAGDRYILNWLADREAVAAYEWSARLAGLINMLLVQSFQLAFTVVGLKALASGAASFYRRTFRHFAIWTGAAILILSVWTPEGMRVLIWLFDIEAAYLQATSLVFP